MAQAVALPEITVTPPGQTPPLILTTPSGNPWDDAPDWKPPQARTAEPNVSATPWADAPDWKPTSRAPMREVGTGEAVGRGAIDTAMFGLGPAMAGATEAGRAGRTPQEIATQENVGVAQEAPGLESIGIGLARLFSNHPDPEARAAYERGRQAALEDQRAAREQHPYAYFSGQLIGGLATPGFGAGVAGTLPARLATGAIAGGIGGGLYGAGEAISEGASGSDVASAAARGALIGAPTGSVLKGVVGPRVPQPPTSPGQRAAATAADLGAPLPRGIASDRPMVQGTTAKLASMPLAGERVGHRVQETAEAAGNRVAETAQHMTGGPTDRAAADVMIRPALQGVIDNNRKRIDQAYDRVRSAIDQNARYTMPRTSATLDAIVRERAAAGWPNPEQGLEQFRNVAQGTTFNGAHRARVDAREAGNAVVPHPGYNGADYNRITRAMTADLRQMIHQASVARSGMRANPQAAVRAFDEAETQFGRLAEQNALLHRLLNAKGEGAIATLLGAAKEKSGNVPLLAQLRQSMPRQDFEIIGGTLLHELGQNNATGEFSLAQFVTNWNKLSDRATGVLFSPQHRQNIDDIINLGSHIKGALRLSNTSHTATVLMLLDVAKDAALLGADIASGGLGLPSAIGFGSTAGLWTLTHWLASPSKAASMAAWSRAYAGLGQKPTPARVAVFKLATRNMANNIGIDPVVLAKRLEGQIQGLLPGKAEDQGTDKKQ